MNYVELHLNDYAAATFHLTPLEDGIYWRLLRCYYRDEAPLPGNLAKVARLVGARTDDEQQALESILAEFFVLGEDGYRQARADAELARYRERSEKAKASAAAGWAKRGKRPQNDGSASAGEDHPAEDAGAQQPQGDGNANAMRPHSEGGADAVRSHSDGNATHSPSPIPHRPGDEYTPPAEPAAGVPPAGAGVAEEGANGDKLPRAKFLSISDLVADGVRADVARDFLQHRRNSNAKLTQRAWDGIKREAKAADWLIDAVLLKCIERGWRGFEASWVANQPRPGPQVTGKQAALEQHNRQVAQAWAEGGDA